MSARLYALPHPSEITAGDHLPRFIHHLGPRYNATFQSRSLAKFLTYEASTSLNIFLSNLGTSKSGTPPDVVALVKAINDGIGIEEAFVVFSFSPAAYLPSTDGALTTLSRFTKDGNVHTTKAHCVDTAMWEIGGVAVPLRLIQLSKVRLVYVFRESSQWSCTDTARTLSNTWYTNRRVEKQLAELRGHGTYAYVIIHIRTPTVVGLWNSIGGYEILSEILRNKSALINMTSYETLFEFLGMNFKTPELVVANVSSGRGSYLHFAATRQSPIPLLIGSLPSTLSFGRGLVTKFSAFTSSTLSILSRGVVIDASM